MSDPVRDHLDKAENWLALAEGNRSELVSLHEGTGTYTQVEDAQRWYFSTMMESAKDLAELHRAMAQTINDLTPQRYAVGPTLHSIPAPDIEALREALAEKIDPPPSPDEVAEKIREQVAADEAEHQATTLRPGVDPEPPSEGELLTTGDGWFFYAVSKAPDWPNRWLMAQHYAQMLRWSSERGAKPTPLTWSKLAYVRAPGEHEVVLRRPTDAERAAFYGPEPDPQPAIEETHERTTTIPDDGESVTPGWVHVDGTGLDQLNAVELRMLHEKVGRLIPVREGRQAPRGAATQWREW